MTSVNCFRFICKAFCLLFFLFPGSIFGQATQVRGVVTDALTGDPLPFVNVVAEGKQIGVTTDFDGQFLLQSVEQFNSITVILLGYQKETRPVQPGRMQTLNFKLRRESKELKELVVKAFKYRNKDNPAVELIHRVIDHKKQNRKEELSAYQVEKYEKVQFALSNITEKFKNKRYLKKFQFVFENTDSSKLHGRVILPIYLKETLSDVYYRKLHKDKKEVIKGSKNVNFEKYFDNEGIGSFMGYLYQDIDIYHNSLPILTNPFICPIADNGPLYYRYYIVDTTMVDSVKAIHVSFFPRNKSDQLLQGELYITLDSSYAVCKASFTVSTEINLNFVKEMHIDQEFKQESPGEWLLTKEETSIDFGVAKNGMGLYGQRSQTFKNYVLNQPKEEKFYSGPDEVISDSVKNRSDEFWIENRHVDLSRSEQGVYNMMDSIQKIPAFRHTMNLMVLLFAGYKDFGKFEIGPINTFYSYNPIEGFRLRFGGRTTRAFSKKFNIESYAAYGLKDERLKYYVGTTYALGPKAYNEFPLQTVQVSYQEETKIPGQELQFVQEDNILLSIKRGDNDKWLYNKIFNFNYLHEFANHFSYTAGIKLWQQAPAGSLVFNPVDYYDSPNNNVENIRTTELILGLRIAPHEQFYQGRSYRIPMQNQYPIFQVRLTSGFKGLAGGEYDFYNLQFSMQKRIFLPPGGYTDVYVEAGKLFGQVPYPLLDIHRANQTFSYQLLSYNLMNFLEFVSDRYVAINIDHYFNGFFFNKIPLFKKLKWREVATVKMLFGSVRDENDPLKTDGLFKFPVNKDGTPLTYTLEDKPYIEGSIGVANILKIFRIDLIKRFSYLDHPVVRGFGIRGRFKLDF